LLITRLRINSAVVKSEMKGSCQGSGFSPANYLGDSINAPTGAIVASLLRLRLPAR
jgi:hypothetical protein